MTGGKGKSVREIFGTVRAARRRASCIALAATAAGSLVVGLAAAPSAGANPVTSAKSCSFGSGLTLNVRAAASVAAGSGRTVGSSRAARIASGLQQRADICQFSPDSRIAAQIAHVAAQYRVGAAQGRAALDSFLQGAQQSPRVVRAPRLVPHGPGPCPAIAPTIHLSGAATTVDDLKAAQAAAAAGDGPGAQSAMNAAAQAFETWASQAGATTVGDWISIAAAAQALGDESLANGAIAHAQSAAEALIKKSSPADPCKASPHEINCFVQAAVVGELIGASNVPDLSGLLDCNGQLWRFSMTLKSQGIVARWNTAEFRLAKDGKVTPAGAGSGSIPGGRATITGNCGGNGDFLIVEPTSFHYSITGRRTARYFALMLTSHDLKLETRTNSDPSLCLRAADGLLKRFVDSFFAHYPAQFPARRSQSAVTWRFRSAGFTATIHAAKT